MGNQGEKPSLGLILKILSSRQYPSIDVLQAAEKQTKKLRFFFIHTMECYSALKRCGFLVFWGECMEGRGQMERERANPKQPPCSL